MLSTERLRSIRYPARYSPAATPPCQNQISPPKATPSASHTTLHVTASRRETSCALRWNTKRSRARRMRTTPPNAAQANQSIAINKKPPEPCLRHFSEGLSRPGRGRLHRAQRRDDDGAYGEILPSGCTHY